MVPEALWTASGKRERSGGRLTLTAQKPWVDAAIIVSDLAGQTLMVRLGIAGTEAGIDIGMLPKGCYSVRVEDDLVRMTGRFHKN